MLTFLSTEPSLFSSRSDILSQQALRRSRTARDGTCACRGARRASPYCTHCHKQEEDPGSCCVVPYSSQRWPCFHRGIGRQRCPRRTVCIPLDGTGPGKCDFHNQGQLHKHHDKKRGPHARGYCLPWHRRTRCLAQPSHSSIETSQRHGTVHKARGDTVPCRSSSKEAACHRWHRKGAGRWSMEVCRIVLQSPSFHKHTVGQVAQLHMEDMAQDDKQPHMGAGSRTYEAGCTAPSRNALWLPFPVWPHSSTEAPAQSGRQTYSKDTSTRLALRGFGSSG